MFVPLLTPLSAVLLVALSGCAPQPLLDLTFGPPPLMATGAYRSITDERGRFREILCAVTEAHGDDFAVRRPCADVLMLNGKEAPGSGQSVYLGPARKKLRIATVSGLGADCFAGMVTPFDKSLQHLQELGYATSTIPIRGLASSTYNASIISDALLNMRLADDEEVVLIGYSKGIADVLEFMSMYPHMARKVAAVVSISGAVSGTLLAEGAPEFLLPWLKLFPGGQCYSADLGAVESLRRSVRLRWFANNTLPTSALYYSVATFANRENISNFLRAGYDELSRIDPRNDGKMLYYDQIIPGSRLIAFVNSDHWASVVPIDDDHPILRALIADRNAFPREVLLESIIRQVEEDLLAKAPLVAHAGPESPSTVTLSRAASSNNDAPFFPVDAVALRQSAQ
ncbi:MAG: hypothetical protein JNM75_15585 [Rhodospirillales bacterium]|nr:hypothetical protein [Rhodospirillales bacterium]